jgi:RNA polymerase sigma-19 factor, ECF subfamily
LRACDNHALSTSAISEMTSSSDGRSSDAQLAERIRRGDERAFERLLQARWTPLVGYVIGRIGDAELAKDVAQEAFARLWEQRREIDPSRSVVAYLYQVARRCAIDELRKLDVRARWMERERRLIVWTGSAEAPQFGHVAERELLAALEGAIARLPTRRREAFILVHVQDLSYRQAAEAMGSARQTVANQVAAALLQLRRELKELIADPADLQAVAAGR